MKNVSVQIQGKIVASYIRGFLYREIEQIYGVNRWNIQDALSKLGVKTDRISSHPRLPGSKKKNYTLVDEYAPIPRQGYHDGDYLPPIKVNKNNPVLNDDLDIMERMDNVDDADTIEGSYEMVIDENNKVRYEEI